MWITIAREACFIGQKHYQETISESEPYDELKRAIIINIMDYNLIQETKKYHTIIEAMARTEHFLFTDVMEIHYLELCKFNPCKDNDYLDGMELWLTFFKVAGREEGKKSLNRLSERSEAIKMAIHQLKKISSDEQMRCKYLEQEMARRDEISRISQAEKTGIEKGIEKGKEEIIRIMLSRGLGIEEVAELTDEDVSRIAKIATTLESSPNES